MKSYLITLFATGLSVGLIRFLGKNGRDLDRYLSFLTSLIMILTVIVPIIDLVKEIPRFDGVAEVTVPGEDKSEEMLLSLAQNALENTIKKTLEREFGLEIPQVKVVLIRDGELFLVRSITLFSKSAVPLNIVRFLEREYDCEVYEAE